jgi:hypothetical protein
MEPVKFTNYNFARRSKDEFRTKKIIIFGIAQGLKIIYGSG